MKGEDWEFTKGIVFIVIVITFGSVLGWKIYQSKTPEGISERAELEARQKHKESERRKNRLTPHIPNVTHETLYYSE